MRGIDDLWQRKMKRGIERKEAQLLIKTKVSSAENI
jgi:hypothetical protein